MGFADKHWGDRQRCTGFSSGWPGRYGVYLHCWRSGINASNRLYAIDHTDGSVKWVYAIEYQSKGSPAIGSGGVIYIPNSNGEVLAFNPDSTLKWGVTTGSSNISAPG